MPNTYRAVVIGVSETSTQAALCAEQLLMHHGLDVSDRFAIDGSEVDRTASTAALGGADLVVAIGPAEAVQTPLDAMIDRRLPVVDALFAVRRFRQVGGAALGEAFACGFSGGALVVGVSSEDEAVQLALGLVLPQLAALRGDAEAVAAPAAEDEEELVAEAVEEEVAEEDDTPPPPDHTTTVGGMSLGSSEMRAEGPSLDAAVPGMDNPPGWKRWVFEHEGEVLTGRREELPNSIDELAPVLQILHTCGEQAVLKLGRNKMSLWGWPDLQRPSSKVIAIGWGLPYVEVVALHRDVPTGLAIEEDRALVHQRSVDLGALSKELTGRTLKNTDGELFACEQGTIWVDRDGKIYAWDGKREQMIGTRNQALASLLLGWTQR